MAFFTAKVGGIVYIFKMILDDGTIVYKIGITSRDSVEDRLAEVLIGFFKVYRYIPRTTVKKCSRCKCPADVEKQLHGEYAQYLYGFDKVFGGFSEFVSGVDEDELIKRYNELMKV